LQYWRDGLKYGKFLEHKTEGLCQDLGVSYGDYDGKKDPHTAPDGGNGFLVGSGRKDSGQKTMPGLVARR
jgi:hypothetical protein